MSSPEHKQKIWKLISKIGTGMLVSEKNDGLHARPMHLVQDEYDGTLWFFTQAPSPKVEEIQSHRDVCVTFASDKDQVFVSLYGKATINRDREMIDKLWNPVVAAWFPEGKDSENCALLEVKVKSGEHWDSDKSTAGFMYEVAKANVKDEQPDMGEHQKFG